MVVAGALPPASWSPERSTPSRPPVGADPVDGSAAARSPLADTVELTGGTQPQMHAPSQPPSQAPSQAPSTWLERASQVAGAGRGSASGSLGLDVVV